MQEVLGWIVLAGAAAAAIAKWIAAPVWNWITAKVERDKAMPVLMAIASQFEENSGTSLHDRIVQIERNQTAMSADIHALTNKFDVYILQSQPGGRRATDP